MKEWRIPEGGASWALRWEITRAFLDIPVSRRVYACLEFITDDGVPPIHINRETRKKKWLFFTIKNDYAYRKSIKKVLRNKGTVTVGATPRMQW